MSPRETGVGAERLYRREMVTLGTEHDARRLELWRNLAEVHDERLDDPESALAAYEAVIGMDPSDVAARGRMIDIYDRLVATDFARYGDAAVRRHQEHLAVQPHAADSLHALFELFRRGGEMDKAFCAASVLALLRKASRSEIDVVERFRRHDLVQSRVALPEGVVHKHLMHGEVDAHLSGMFSLLAPALLQLQAHKLPAVLRRRPVIAPASDETPLGRLVDYTRRVLGVMAPDVYVHPDLGTDYALMCVRDGDQAKLALCIDDATLRSRSHLPFTFELGRELVGLYPPFQAYFMFGRSGTQLRQVVLAALRMVGAGVGAVDRETEQLARRMTPLLARGATQALTGIVRHFLEAGGVADLDRFGRAVECTGLRAGLTLCGDVGVAADAIAQARAAPASRLDRKSQLRELVGFAVSEDFFALRHRLGLRQETPRKSTRTLPRPAGLS